MARYSSGPSQSKQDVARDPASPRKRKKNVAATSERGPTPSKRGRVTRAGKRGPFGEKKPEQTAKPSLEQPKPTKPGQRPTFLREFTDPVRRERRRKSINATVSKWLASLTPRLEMETSCDGEKPIVSPQLDSPDLRSSPTSHPESITPPDHTDSIPASCQTSPLVKHPRYRDLNLVANNIFLRDECKTIPQHVARLVDHISRDCESVRALEDATRHELFALFKGAGESQVVNFFRGGIFSLNRLTELRRSDGQLMARHAVPCTGSSHAVSTPKPDFLFGYKGHEALRQQQPQLVSVGLEPMANNENLMYPFLLAEFKGDGPSGAGSMWVATNQCLGGSASCANMAEQLNQRLRRRQSHDIHVIDSTVFSVAMNGAEARLYVTWKHQERSYYMAFVRGFYFQDPDRYAQFCAYVRNIMEWGEGERLERIRGSLGVLLGGDGRKGARPPRSARPARRCEGAVHESTRGAVGRVRRAGSRYTAEEDNLLVELRESAGDLSWAEVHRHFSAEFPGRTRRSLQARYSAKLKGWAHRG